MASCGHLVGRASALLPATQARPSAVATTALPPHRVSVSHTQLYPTASSRQPLGSLQAQPQVPGHCYAPRRLTARDLSVRAAAELSELDDSTQGDTEDDEWAGWGGVEVDAVGVTHPNWDPGNAFSATLRMLEWPRLCEMVADHAVTQAGRAACLRLGVPPTQEESEAMLTLTRVCTILEYDWATILDFGGINTVDGQRALRRAAKGAACSPVELRAVASLIAGGEKMRKQVLVALRENVEGRGRGNPLNPMMPWVNKLKPQPQLVRDIISAIDDEGNIMDSASETLRQCRLRVRQLTTRLNNLLKGYGGEVTEKGGRVCVGLPAGTKLPGASMLLGTSQGGGVVYVEPPAAVPLNNELAAARGEAYSAADDVLFSLTGKLMGVLPEVEETYKAIVLLDVLTAKVKFGLHINGILPSFIPWNSIFHERGAQAVRRRQAAAGAGGYALAPGDTSADTMYDSGGVNSNGGSEDDLGGGRYALRLRGLRHPLLLGTYLKEKARLEKELRKAGVNVEELAAGGDPAIASQRRLSGSRASGLSKRREGMLRAYGLDQAPNKKRANDAAVMEMIEAYKSLRPPVPLDITVKPHTSVVVITGPNTGGKTATMKALGLYALMARAGLALPCDAPALLPAFSSVLADIGDEQSLTANLSTFSGHLARIQALRAEADGRSLVLLDELGTGTDPVEGAALGVALLRRMADGGLGGGALTIATTHHSMMTGLKFDDTQERFENASVEFDTVALAPTYKLLWGIPGRSNALSIAERLGLDKEVVDAARERLDSNVSIADDNITELETLRTQLQDEETALWAVSQEVSALTEAMSDLKEDVRTLQHHLTVAKDQALFDVWLAATERLKRFRESKRVKGVAVPHTQQDTSTPARSPEELIKDMAVLAAQITGQAPSPHTPTPALSTDTHTDHSSSLSQPSEVTRMSGGITLEDLVDARVEVTDLLDDISALGDAKKEEERAKEAAFHKVLDNFEALAAQQAQAAEQAADAARAAQEAEEQRRRAAAAAAQAAAQSAEVAEYEQLASLLIDVASQAPLPPPTIPTAPHATQLQAPHSRSVSQTQSSQGYTEPDTDTHTDTHDPIQDDFGATMDELEALMGRFAADVESSTAANVAQAKSKAKAKRGGPQGQGQGQTQGRGQQGVSTGAGAGSQSTRKQGHGRHGSVTSSVSGSSHSSVSDSVTPSSEEDDLAALIAAIEDSPVLSSGVGAGGDGGGARNGQRRQQGAKRRGGKQRKQA